jgi:hypothetical protein
MKRQFVTAIDLFGSLSRCDAALPAQGLQLAGMPASAGDAHDFGRESDATNTSGEGPG